MKSLKIIHWKHLLCVCVCICMCVFDVSCVCVCVYLYVCMRACPCSVCLCMCERVSACVFLFGICGCVCLCVCVRMRAYVSVRVSRRVSVRGYMCQHLFNKFVTFSYYRQCTGKINTKWWTARCMILINDILYHEVYISILSWMTLCNMNYCVGYMSILSLLITSLKSSNQVSKDVMKLQSNILLCYEYCWSVGKYVVF